MGTYASDQAACWGYCARTLNNTEPCGSMEKSTAIYVDIGVYNYNYSVAYASETLLELSS